MEKTGYRCFKCNRRFLSRRQLALWGEHYWCDTCIEKEVNEKRAAREKRIALHALPVLRKEGMKK